MNPAEASVQSRPRVLVVDDEGRIRRFLAISLRAQGYEVDEAANGRDALQRLAGQGFQLVILDLGLPDLDGRDVLRALRAFSAVPVLVLSVRASESEKVALLDAGANDYMSKPFGMQELSARLRVLLRQPVGADVAAAFDDGVLRVDFSLRQAWLEGLPLALSRKEWSLLALLVQHAGQLVTQPQLLRQLWGPTHLDDTHYLRILAAKLRGKLGDDAANPRYIATEPGVGLRFVG
jgi:two-component system KDP operon response regulator KdpE